jgi:hypothetical protein
VLALLFLTMFDEDQYGARYGNGTTGTQWIDRLQAKGYISDPRSKAKSAVVTRKRREAIPQTVRETLREETTGGAASGRIRGDSDRAHSEAGRGYGRGSRRVKPRSAKSAERLAAALRSGALTGRAHARKPSRYVRNVSLCPSRGQRFPHEVPKLILCISSC